MGRNLFSISAFKKLNKRAPSRRELGAMKAINKISNNITKTTGCTLNYAAARVSSKRRTSR